MEENKTPKIDDLVDQKDIPQKPKSVQPKPRTSDRFRKLKWWVKTHKKETILFSAILLAVLIAGGGFAYTRLKKKPVPPPEPEPAPKVEEPPKPEPIVSPLTGAQTTAELAARPVTGMMVENSPEARPQSGLNEAGVVFEATAEGGITRFLALFQETKPALIGPCRSLRPYYIDFALPFQAAVGHVGGSPQALAEAKIVGLRDIDQFANGSYYWRDQSRYAPHNMYTSTEKLDQLLQSKGYTKSEFSPWPRKEDKAIEVPSASVINLDISSANYKATFNYDKSSNSYLRSVGGKPHVNREDGKQITPKVVIAIQTPHRIISSAGHYGMDLVGSGKAWVFMDGGVTEATWSKTAREKMFNFADTSGAEIKLNAGQTWITVVPTGKATAVTYNP